MFLLVGLGNPGPEYENNRHNIGFMVLDALHRGGFGPWKSRFGGVTAEGSLGAARTILLKPLTYMNESGRAVGEAARFLKIEPKDILVIHDEIDLPPGKVRMKAGGGSGGHNGIRSISAHIGDGYRRMRLGVGHPGHKAAVHNHVLRDFAKADAAWLTPLLDAIVANATLLAEGKDATFANRVHLATGEDPSPPPTAAKAAPAAKAQRTKPPNEIVADRPDTAVPPVGAAGPEQGGPLAGALRRLFGRKP